MRSGLERFAWKPQETPSGSHPVDVMCNRLVSQPEKDEEEDADDWPGPEAELFGSELLGSEVAEDEVGESVDATEIVVNYIPAGVGLQGCLGVNRHDPRLHWKREQDIQCCESEQPEEAAV